MTALEARLERLEALEAIRALKARYAALCDAKYSSAYTRVDDAEWRRIAQLQAACFAPDTVWDGGERFGGALHGRDALAEWFERSPWRFALHYYVAPELVVHDADSAAGRWRLWQLAIPDGGDAPVLLAATTDEDYRRTPEGWLVARMRFTEIHRVDLAAAPAALSCLLPRSAA